MRRGVRPHIPTLPSRSSALITWLPQCSGETFVPLGGTGPSVLQTLGARTIVVNGAAVSTRGRLLHATTDCQFLCSPISSISAVCQLSTASYFVLRTRGTDSASRACQRGRKEENFESNGCAWRARKLGKQSHRGGDLRAGEKVRERASPGQFILSAQEEHWTRTVYQVHRKSTLD